MNQGSITIWFGLGAGNFVAVILCGVYFVKYISWDTAVMDSKKRLRQTIDSVNTGTASRSNTDREKIIQEYDDDGNYNFDKENTDYDYKPVDENVQV